MQKPRTRQDNLISEEVQGERVVYDSSSKKAHYLNATLSWIWSHCDGSRTIDDLAVAMQDTGNNDARALIVGGLKQLADANLLEAESVDVNALVSQGSMVSRRAAVMAGASMVAPVMVSILAPTPLAAQSPAPGKDKGKKSKR